MKRHKLKDYGALELQSLFAYPKAEAAKRLGVGVSTLLRKCRKVGIKTWPYVVNRTDPTREQGPSTSVPADVGLQSADRSCGKRRNSGSSEAAVAMDRRAAARYRLERGLAAPDGRLDKSTRAWQTLGEDPDAGKVGGEGGMNERMMCLQTKANNSMLSLLKRLRSQQRGREVEVVMESTEKSKILQDRMLFEKVGPVYQRMRLRMQGKDVYKGVSMPSLIAVLDEAVGRLCTKRYIGDIGVARTASGAMRVHGLEGSGQEKLRTVFAKNLRSPRLAKWLIGIHDESSVKQNMYTHPFFMASWLAGLGHEHFDAREGTLAGIQKLRRKIERSEIQAMSDFGRLLRIHGVNPPPHHFAFPSRRKGSGEEDPVVQEIIASVQELEREDVKARPVMPRKEEWIGMSEGEVKCFQFLVQVQRTADICLNVEKERRRDHIHCLCSKATEYRNIPEQDIFALQSNLGFELMGRTDVEILQQLDPLALCMHIKMLEEVKLRLCCTRKGIAELPVTDRLFDIYVPTLVCQTSMWEKLLRHHQQGGANPYTDAFVMAEWLVALGYTSENLRSQKEEVHLLGEKIRCGAFDPLPEFSRLLHENDLPWPPHSFSSVIFDPNRSSAEGSSSMDGSER